MTTHPAIQKKIVAMARKGVLYKIIAYECGVALRTVGKIASRHGYRRQTPTMPKARRVIAMARAGRMHREISAALRINTASIGRILAAAGIRGKASSRRVRGG